MTEIRKAGQYQLKKFELRKVNGSQSLDIKSLIHTWELVETMNDGYIHGSAKVFDAVGAFYDFIRCEEYVTIIYEDWFGVEINHDLFVYSISNVEYQNPANETIITYTLHFVSKNKLITENKQIRKAFKDGLISDYAREIYSTYYTQSSRELIVQSTEGPQDLVVPNYTPDETMHFFARKAHSGNLNTTETFRFFENRLGHYFISHDQLSTEQLSNDINVYIKVNESDQSPEGQRLLMQNIIKIQFPVISNVIDDIASGNYYRSVTELDILNRRVTQTSYQYLDEYGQYALPDKTVSDSNKNIHTKAFVDEYMNHLHDTLVIKDYPSLSNPTGDISNRSHPYYANIYNKKAPNLNHHMNNMVELTVYGRNDIFAGNYVKLELLKSTGDLSGREVDEERSGLYLIENIRNVFYENDYIQVMSISKSGLKGSPEAASNYDKNPREIGTI